MTLIEFQKKLADNPRPVVVDFWAPWCAPCRSISPALEELARENEGQVDLWKVNADENRELLQALRIYGIPTLIAYRDGQEVLRKTGAQPLERLAELFQTAGTGQVPIRSGPALGQRVLRLVAAVTIFAIGWVNGPSLPLLGIGGLVFFSAVYDRCPIWQAIAPRLAKLFHLPA